MHRVSRKVLFPILALLALVEVDVKANVVAVVSAESPFAALSKAEVADIFLGKISRFPDGRLVVPLDQAEGLAIRDEFYLKVTGKSDAQIRAYWSKLIFTGRGQPPREVANSSDVKKRVIANTASIGYIDESYVDASVRVVF